LIREGGENEKDNGNRRGRGTVRAANQGTSYFHNWRDSELQLSGVVGGLAGLLRNAIVTYNNPKIEFKDTGLMETYADPLWPAATIKVLQEGLEKDDPRHPNPAAGSTRTYVVEAGGHRGCPSAILAPPRSTPRNCTSVWSLFWSQSSRQKPLPLECSDGKASRRNCAAAVALHLR
jgi:hypothetical protein